MDNTAMGSSTPERMTTVRRLDGENIYDEFGWVADDEENLACDYEDCEEPIAYERQTWVLVSSETFYGFPRLFACDFEDQDPCEEDAVEWVRTTDDVWLQACQRHAESNGSGKKETTDV